MFEFVPSSFLTLVMVCTVCQTPPIKFLFFTLFQKFIKTPPIHLPSFVKDTGHMISIWESLDPLTTGCILVTFDVEALYTNVPHEGGIQTLECFLQSCNIHSNPSDHCITTLAELVLAHTFFISQDRFLFAMKRRSYGLQHVL